MYTVYCHTNKINGKKYVGITGREVNKRWLNGKGYQDNPHFNNAIKKYGWDNFDHEILYSEITKEKAKKIEIELIKMLKLQDPEYGYNVADGGDLVNVETREKISNTLKGHNISDETRKKISESLTGRKIPKEVVEKSAQKLRGTHLSEDRKRKISETEKGKKVSDETKEKLRLAAIGNKNMLGKKHSIEAKKRMSEKTLKRKVKNIRTGAVYPSIKEAAEIEGVHWNTIFYHCSDKFKNKKWEYVENEMDS